MEDEIATLQIHRILHRMEEPYKEVFQLRVFGELSFQKIGRIFEKTETWARVTYHRARLKIQERMEAFRRRLTSGQGLHYSQAYQYNSQKRSEGHKAFTSPCSVSAIFRILSFSTLHTFLS